jgi:predicted DNA-binding transcriptional regulator AlpA
VGGGCPVSAANLRLMRLQQVEQHLGMSCPIWRKSRKNKNYDRKNKTKLTLPEIHSPMLF